MTPQQLIDLPYYGMAEIELRKSGRWKLTPVEILYGIDEDHCSDPVNKAIDRAIDQLEQTT